MRLSDFARRARKGAAAPFAFYAVAAMTAFSFMGPLIRQASAHVPVLEVVFFRNLLAIVLIAPPLLLSLGWGALRTQRLGLHVARNVVGAAAMAAGFLAVTMIPLAESQALGFTAPLFATIGAAAFLGERVRIHRISALAAGFLGMTIVLAPQLGAGDGGEQARIGALLALLSAMLIGGSALMLKRLSEHESAGAVALWMVLMQAPISLVAALFVWEWPSAAALGWMTLLAGAGTIGHLCLNRAARAAEASALQPFEFIKLPLAALWGALFFMEAPSTSLWIGGGVIFVATAYIARREAQLGVQKPAPRRLVE